MKEMIVFCFECMQVKLQHLVTLHVRSSAFGGKEDAGMFMKGLAVQYDVWAETYYQRMLSVSVLAVHLWLDSLCIAHNHHPHCYDCPTIIFTHHHCW